MSLWAQWPRPPLRPEVRCAPRLRGSVQQPIRLAWALCSDVSLAPHAFRSPGRHRQHPCVWPCGAGVSQKQPSEVTADQALRAVALGRGVFVAVTCVTYASRARRCVEPLPPPPPHLLLPRGDRPPSVSPLRSPGPGPPVWTLPSSSALHQVGKWRGQQGKPGARLAGAEDSKQLLTLTELHLAQKLGAIQECGSPNGLLVNKSRHS